MHKVDLENNEQLQREIIGKNIKSYRKARGYTQGNLAHLIDVKRPVITYYENGTRSINMINLIKISDFLNIQLSDLLEENPEAIAMNSVVAFKKDYLKDQDIQAIADFGRIVSNYIKLSE